MGILWEWISRPATKPANNNAAIAAEINRIKAFVPYVNDAADKRQRATTKGYLQEIFGGIERIEGML